jgi:crooked neck
LLRLRALHPALFTHPVHTPRARSASGGKEARALVIEAWKEMEEEMGDADRLAVVEARLPKRIKKKRALEGDDGEHMGWEEYIDYVFPEEEAKAPSLKILEMAHKWKKQKTDDE